MQKFRHLPIASLGMFTLGALVSHDFSSGYLASMVIVFLAATLLWAVGTRYSPN